MSHKTGCQLIIAERFKQVAQKKHTVKKDKDLEEGALAGVAQAYAGFAVASMAIRDLLRKEGTTPPFWPWKELAWKPEKGDTPRDQIRDLAKAGALIAAEIDRLIAIQEETDA